MYDRMKVNYHLVNMIIESVLGVKEMGKAPANYPYLLGQIIRQYQLPEKNWHMSEGFYALWSSITTAEVYGGYDEKITCEYDGVDLRIYKGNATKIYKEETSVKGKSYKWNSLFICEHVTTVSDITKKLLALENVNAESVVKILDGIHLCRLTKEENSRISAVGKGVTSHREGSYEDIVNNIYSKAGIKVI